jgi:enoyl-[acyl-carrier-protein] reductase (NADH)
MWMNYKYIYLISFNKVSKIIIKSIISLKKSLKSMEIVSYNICSSKELTNRHDQIKKKWDNIFFIYFYLKIFN